MVKAGPWEGTCFLPATLDEAGIGTVETEAESWHPDAHLEVDEENNTSTVQKKKYITTRFTRKAAFEGKAVYERRFDAKEQDQINGLCKENDRVFISVERSRKLSLWVNDREVEAYEAGTLSTPYCFEVTGLNLEKIVFVCDNTYEHWPVRSIKYSSAASNETQTNWNGLLGKLELFGRKSSFIEHIIVHPYRLEEAKSMEWNVILYIDAAEAFTEEVQIQFQKLGMTFKKRLEIRQGRHAYETAFKIAQREMQNDFRTYFWSMDTPELEVISVKGNRLTEKKESFGIRFLDQNERGDLRLNKQRIFLRMETNCCVFADTGHMPLTVEEWNQIFKTYASYGINAVRFHSHCPPKEAFTAADQTGILLQVELSNWDPKNAFGEPYAKEYYQLELEQILWNYGNHPSFAFLSLGNELWPQEVGILVQKLLIKKAKTMDPTRFYLSSSNGFYGVNGPMPEEDLYTSANYLEETIRATNSGMTGMLNKQEPNSTFSYSKVVEKIKQQKNIPVVSFEVGQYEILPDLKEIDSFCGVLLPNNLRAVEERVKEAGMDKDWEERVEITGRMAKMCYRAEIEATLRTPNMSGIALLGMQDFPGQGTALVGMLNSHLRPKSYGFSSNEDWKQFCADQVVLLLLDRFVYREEELFTGRIQFANYGREEVCGTLRVTFTEEISGEEVCLLEKPVKAKKGELTELGEVKALFPGKKKNVSYTVKTEVVTKQENYVNTYVVWVYGKKNSYQQRNYFSKEKEDATKENTKENTKEEILITQDMKEAVNACKEGKKVFLSPKVEDLQKIEGMNTCFTTDFWSVKTFPDQPGYMGCIIENEHPIYQYFPTKNYPEWQWWHLTTDAYAVVVSDNTKPLLEVMDSYARIRKLAFLVEAKVGKGKLLFSSMGLLEKQKFPEVTALLEGIFDYMESDLFLPEK